jgi:hypothetical protein
MTEPCDKVIDLGADAVLEEHVLGCTNCQENLRIVRPIRNMYSGMSPPDGWRDKVLARIDERE